MKTIKATRPEIPGYLDYIDELKDIFESGLMTNNGPKTIKLEELLRNRIGSNGLQLFVNGHTALVAAIMAMGFKPGAKVLTSAFTFASTTNAIVQCGLEPVFCDIDDSYNICVESIERNLDENVCAIITPHIFGIPCDVEKIEALAKKHGITVIYDGAQAFGTRIEGKDIGCFGDACMFSLHAIKVYNSIEGGILAYKNEKLSTWFEEYRNFGISTSEEFDVNVCGINGKIDEFRAAMGIVNFYKINEVLERRRRIAELYVEGLKDISGIWTFPYDSVVEYNYAYFPIRINRSQYGLSRDGLFDRLNERGIGTRKLYNCLTCDFNIYKHRKFISDVEYARHISQICLDLPIYSALSDDDVNDIIRVIRENGR